MALTKVTYVDNQTVIEAAQLNAIQDELIRVAGLLGKDIQSAAINDSGHLILTLTDGTTLDAGVAKGATGPAGADGKSAYRYAVEIGYTGTEAEFAAKLAQEIPTVDSTLTQFGQAADAKAVGDALAEKQDSGNYVKSVNGTTPDASGNVTVEAGDGGAGIYVGDTAPSDTSMLWVDTSDNEGSTVDSVNGKTGTVVLTAEDVGAIPAGASVDYTLPVATAETLGGVKVGEGLSIDASGVLSASGSGSSGGGWKTIGTKLFDGTENSVEFALNGERLLHLTVDNTKAIGSIAIQPYVASGAQIPTLPLANPNTTEFNPKYHAIILAGSRNMTVFSGGFEGTIYQGSFKMGMSGNYNSTAEQRIADDPLTKLTVTFGTAPVSGAGIRLEGM